jgi:diguanylate cyclase (GGDEF)-like protein
MGAKSKLASGVSFKIPAVMLVSAVLLMLIFCAITLTRIADEANAVGFQRTSLALKQALAAQHKQMLMVASDNAEWDDAAFALYADKVDADFAVRSWMAGTGVRMPYDSAFVVGKHEAFNLSFENGQSTGRSVRDKYGANFAAAFDQVRARGERFSGLVKSGGDLHIVGAVKVAAIEEKNMRLFEKKPPVYLILSRRLDAETLAEMAKLQSINNLELSPVVKTHGAALSDFSGERIGWLTWQAEQPGSAAVDRMLPVMLGGMTLFLIILSAIGWFTWTMIASMNHWAGHDPLSKLPNRRLLRSEMRRAMKEGNHVALAFVDLDGFKAVNDNFGHAVGDDLIVKCAGLVRDVAKDCELVARLGGDEFAILATGKFAKARVQAAADAMLKRMHEPFRLGERAIMIGASIGLSHVSGHGQSSSALMREADIAMYAAKNAGKMRTCWFTSQLDQMQAKAHAIETMMREGLRETGFRVNYQPVVDSNTGEIKSVEALLRWSDADGNEHDPSEFVPIAEESGLINPLGLFVLRQACLDALNWPGLGLAVNVSAAQLRNPDFPAQLAKLLVETGFDPARLQIEITETYIIDDPEMATRMLDEIRGLGVSIALDDYGNGYASIAYLRRFRFDMLKFDRSLIADIASSAKARSLLVACVQIAKTLDLKITAEGIETQAQADLACATGCDMLQGWYFGRAVEAGEIARLIATQHAPQARRKLRS